MPQQNTMPLNRIARRIGFAEADLSTLIRHLPGAPITIQRGRVFADLREMIDFLNEHSIAVLRDPGIDESNDQEDRHMEADVEDEEDDGDDADDASDNVGDGNDRDDDTDHGSVRRNRRGR